MEEQRWQRFCGSFLSASVAEEVNNALLAERSAGNSIRVFLGTDSQVKGGRIDFATVIVFVREGNGAFLFMQKETRYKKMSIRERMLAEVDKTVQLTLQLETVFQLHGIEPELHVDINTCANYKSNAALSDAIGYVTGMGWQYRAKPHAFASSSCANKIVQ